MTRRNLLLTALLSGTAVQANAQESQRAPQAPEFVGATKDWVSGKPVTLAELKGKVVVVCFWTFGCINCKKTLPFWNEWAKRYVDKGVVFVTVHTPELESERVVENVKKFVEREKLVFPVLIDNNMTNWKNWQQQFWPATYIIDKKGRVRGRWDGELDFKGSGEYKKVERGIERLRAW